MRSIRFLVAAFLFCAAFSVRAGETGSVSGKVSDANGGTLPGVLVKISGPQLPAGRTTATGPTGQYNFQRLLPGKYTVEAELSGLGKATRAVDVLVDNDSQVDLSLRGGAETSVEVTAAAVDVKSTEVNFNYKREEINNLPLQRTYTGLVQLVPGVADPDASGLDAGAGTGFSAAGGTRQDNKFLLDGVNITNPGYGVLLVETNELDVADFNVKNAGITAEFGRTTGIVLNAVTKSGTNDLHGSLRVEALPDAFVADSRDPKITQTVDRYTGAANLGFPIVKDMLFGYVSGRYFSSTKSGQSSTTSNGTINQPDTKTRNGDVFGKLTAQPTQSLQFNAGFRALPTKTTDQFDTQFDALTAAYDTDVTNYVTNVTGNWFPTGNTFLEGKFVHLTEHDTADAQNVLTDQPHTIDPAHLERYGAYVPSGQTGNGGYPEFATRGDDYKRDEIKLTASQFLDLGPTQHQVKVGGGYETDDYSLVRATNGWGLMTKSATCPASTCGTSRTAIRARYYTLQPEQTGKARTYSFFVQDAITWQRVSANVGILLNKDDFAQVALDGTRYNFMTFDWGDQVQPRLGVAYNAELLKGDKFYANWGRYTGVDQKTTSRSFAPFRIRQDEAYFDTTTGAYLGQNVRGSSAGKLIPQDLKPPHTDEIVVGYAAPVSSTISFETYFQYRRTTNIFEDVPINPDNFGGAFQAKNLPGAFRRYRGITLDVNKRLSDRWSGEVSYTYSRLDGNFDLDYTTVDVFNTSSILEDAPGINSTDPLREGKLSQDRPHILKVFASYETPLGVTVGAAARLTSGAAWEAHGRDGNGSFYRYLEPAGSRRLPTQATADLLGAYNFHLGGAVGLRAELRVLNVFNTQTAVRVNKTEFNDPYKPGDPPRNPGPQGTLQPNPDFGKYEVYLPGRRLVATATVDF